MVGEVRVVVGENVRANLRTLSDFNWVINWNEKTISVLLLLSHALNGDGIGKEHNKGLNEAEYIPLMKRFENSHFSKLVQNAHIKPHPDPCPSFRVS
jgi:hypothetical protein